MTRAAWAYGLSTTTEAGAVLDTWYPEPALGEAPGQSSLLDVPPLLASLEGADPDREVRTSVVRTTIDLDAAPLDAPEAYLRLPPATLDSRVSEMLEEQVAQADYRIKQQARRFLGFLAQLQEIRRGAGDARNKSGR